LCSALMLCVVLAKPLYNLGRLSASLCGGTRIQTIQPVVYETENC
jgi:hypothetical protein